MTADWALIKISKQTIRNSLYVLYELKIYDIAAAFLYLPACRQTLQTLREPLLNCIYFYAPFD